MSTDLSMDYTPHEEDTMGKQPFGRLALSRLNKQSPLPEGFMLYSASWQGTYPDFHNLRLVGAQIRAATRGPRKGELNIIVPGTTRTITLSREEVRKAEELAQNEAAQVGSSTQPAIAAG